MKKNKKFLILFIFICMVIFTLSACNNNNSDINYDVKNKYVDGKYYVFSNYFDNDSKVAYMSLNIKNNIITKINFNYFYKNNTLYFSNKKKSNNLYFFVKNLNTAVLQNQSSNIDIDVTNDDIYSDYTTLLNKALQLAKKGTINVTYANLKITYKANISSYDSYGYNTYLDVTYEDNKISSVNINKTNKDGQSINNNNVFISSFKKDQNISFEKYINDIKNLSIDNEKLKLSSNNLNIDKQYNKLAKSINKKRQIFNYKNYERFKNL